jgi:peptide/nickel transport system ATP-binding protein
MSVLLEARNLHVTYPNGHEALRGVNITVPSATVTAVIGESGSGKSTFVRAALGMLPGSSRTQGAVLFDGAPVTGRSGRGIGYVPQDPATNLDPLQRVGSALREALAVGGRRPTAAMVLRLIRNVGFGQPELIVRRYPHQLSGGQRQRVLIALGLAGDPALVVADEPTSALDVSVQKEVLDLLCARATEHGSGLLLVTHDIAIALERAGHVIVLQDGKVVEEGHPDCLGSEPYTRELLRAAEGVAYLAPPGPEAKSAPPALRGTGLTKGFGRHRARVQALHNVSFQLGRGETLGIVGESGSGKTTLARTILRLSAVDGGELCAGGVDVLAARGESLRRYRRTVQPVFQNPYASLDPTYTVRKTLVEAIRLGGTDRSDARDGIKSSTGRTSREARVRELLHLVGLEPELADRLPRELSGGQQQRVAIARALAFSPDVIVLDEAVSALDVVVQQRILELLARLQRDLGVSYLFVSHDLAVVRSIAHRVIVMHEGRIIEEGEAREVFDRPRHDYLRQLLASVPGRGWGAKEESK